MDSCFRRNDQVESAFIRTAKAQHSILLAGRTDRKKKNGAKKNERSRKERQACDPFFPIFLFSAMVVFVAAEGRAVSSAALRSSVLALSASVARLVRSLFYSQISLVLM